MQACEKWLEGSCKLGNRCIFVHGKAKNEPLWTISDEELAEECSRWGGQAAKQDGNHASMRMAMWRHQLSNMQPGEELNFTEFSKVECSCIEDIARSLHFEHHTSGVGKSTVLQIRRPLGERLERPIMQLEQCLSLPPADQDEVCKMLKQVLVFHKLCKERKDCKRIMEQSIEKAARQAWTILTSGAKTGSGKAFHSMVDRDCITKKLATLKYRGSVFKTIC